MLRLRNLILAQVVVPLGLATGCNRQRPAAVPVAPPVADPVVAEVDGMALRWGQVQERLKALGDDAHRETKAAALAASDLLVVREMKVVGAAIAATETAAQAADRLLALTWDGSRGCGLSEAEIRLAYMQDLGRYKHPPSWTVWDALGDCCSKPEGCPIADVEQCRDQLRAQLMAMAAQLRADFAAMPALGPAAELTAVRVEESPLRHQQLPHFEAVLADLQAKDRRLKLLRYTFWQQGLPAYEKAHFRRADPAVEKACTGARIGDLIGPIDGEDSPHLLLVAAREPESTGLPHTPTATDEDPVAVQIRKKLCGDMALREREEYRERLLRNAQIVWHPQALVERLAPASVQTLVTESTRQPVQH